jgi:parallel beta-helix repeat protein
MSTEYAKLLNALPRPDLYDSWELVKRHMPIEQPPASASYIVFQKGGQCYAKNGTTGHIEFGPGNASTVIQSAINALPYNGGEIFIIAGEYIITDTITINKPLLLRMESQRAGWSWLKLADGANKSMFNITGNYKTLIFENIYFYGNKENQTVQTSLINIVGTQLDWIIFSDCFIDDAYGKGIYLEPTADMAYGCLVLLNCHVEDNYLAGLHVKADSYKWNHVWVVDSWFDSNGYPANIYFEGRKVRSVNIIGNIILRDGTDGIRLLGTKEVNIVGNIIKDNKEDGIRIYGYSDSYCQNVNIAGNYIGNVDTTQQLYGINLASVYIDYVNIQSNILRGNTNGAVYLTAGANLNGKIKANIGYVTENSGTATFSGNGSQTSFTIPHGLAGTPKSWRVEAGSAGAKGDKYVTADATNLTVTFATAPPTGSNNVVLVWSAEM